MGDRLGQQLLKAGRLTPEDLHAGATRQKRTNQKLGEVLVEMKFLSAEELQGELGRYDGHTQGVALENRRPGPRWLGFALSRPSRRRRRPTRRRPA